MHLLKIIQVTVCNCCEIIKEDWAVEILSYFYCADLQVNLVYVAILEDLPQLIIPLHQLNVNRNEVVRRK